MPIRKIMTVLLAGFLGLSVHAATVSLSGPNAYMNVFELDGATYLWGSAWGVADLKTVTSNAPTYELHPNYNTYEDNPGDPYWRDNAGAGPDGNKVTEGITFFERGLTADLTNAVFNFTVDSGTDLNTGRYGAEAFIQVIDGDGNNVHDTVQPITALGPVPMSLTLAGYTNHTVQAGWRVKGKNANPADAASHGKVIVTLVDLYAVSDDVHAPTPLGFEVAPTAISGTEMTMTALEALDNYDVEYQFSNTVIGTSSDWQSSRTWVDTGLGAGIATAALPIVNADFESAGANWSFENGGGTAVTTTTNVGGDHAEVALISVDGTAGGNWAVIHQQVSLAGTDFSGGDDVTMYADIKALPGLNGGGAALKLESVDGGGGVLSAVETPVSVTESWDRYSVPFTIHADAVAVKVVLVTSAGWGGPTPTDSDYLFDNVAVSGEVATAGGLIPDTEYFYTIRARDLSSLTNMTAWLTPAVAGTSTVFDVTAPTPDPMQFFVAPTAIGDTAISMIASNAVDDSFGVEYLFTNTVSGGSSGWQSSPSWTDAGSLTVSNAGFESAGADWTFESNEGWGDPSGATATNIGGNVALAYVNGSEDNGNGGYAVIWQQIDFAGTGFSAGDTITLSADIKALAGLNGGGAALKVESWGGGANLGNSGDQYQTVTESWDTYSMDYTIAAGADAIKVVLVVSTGWGGQNPIDSYYLFDNVAVSRGGGLSLSPGTEYTYMVKARDTSPGLNETGWSAPASATTTGTAPVPPAFGIDSAEMVSGVGAVFSWEGTAGYTYGVEYTTNLVTGPWMDDPSVSDMLSVGGTMSATSTVDGASIFFRINAE